MLIMEQVEKRIDIAECEAVEALRLACGQELSAYAFPSIYLWQKTLGLSLYVENEMYTVKITKFGSNTWFFPCGCEDAVLRFLAQHEREPDFALCYLRAQDGNFLQKHFGDGYCFIPDMDASEYIYDCEGHRILQGKAYANVRTQLHKIERQHELSVERISDTNAEDCIEVLKAWDDRRATDWSGDIFQVDLTGIKERESLGIEGIFVRVDGRPAGIAAGYPLTADTYDLFLAKADQQVYGLGYYVQRAFFLSRPEGVRWVNMEEDLGIEGLRSMKKRLAPVRMNELWRAYKT